MPVEVTGGLRTSHGPESIRLHAHAPHPPQQDYGQMAMRALRGRYGIAALLALAGIAIGGIIGWRQGTPMYQCEGLVHINNQDPFSKTKTPMQGFDGFLNTQSFRLKGAGVVQLALQDPAWQETGRGSSARVVDDFSRHLTVSRPDESEQLRVVFSDADPKVAWAGTRSLIDAYEHAYNSALNEEEKQKVKELTNQQQALEESGVDLESKLMLARREGESAAVVEVSKKKRDLIAELDGQIMAATIDLQLASGQASTAVPATTEPHSKVPSAWTADQVNEHLLNAVEMGRNIQNEIDTLSAQGIGPANQRMKQLKTALEQTNQQIEKFQDIKQNTFTISATGLASSDIIDGLKRKLEVINAMHDQLVGELNAHLVAEAKILNCQKAIDANAAELKKVTESQTQLTSEYAAKRGLLDVMNRGEMPLVPSIDRRMKMAGAGAIVGGGLPIGIILALGMFRRRYRFVEEAAGDLRKHEGVPLLGVLPSLPSRLKDVEQAVGAAQCIHRMRVLLQHSQRTRSTVYLVTSAKPQEGKTSLSVALGYSFAAAGARTLLIDCDLVGQAMTVGFKATSAPGLCEAMAAGTLQGCIQSLPSGLSVLPVGQMEALGSSAVSTRSIRPLLAEARKQFDVIVVDSGPLLGSVEATVLAPEVDGVVLTVSRGLTPRLVERALEQLHVLHATVAGFVFNRASSVDFQDSYQSSSMRSVPRGELRVQDGRNESKEAAGFGPLVESVASFMPTAVGA